MERLRQPRVPLAPAKSNGPEYGIRVSFCRILVSFVALVVALVGTTILTVSSYQKTGYIESHQRSTVQKLCDAFAYSLQTPMAEEDWTEIRGLVGTMLTLSTDMQSVALIDNENKELLRRIRSGVAESDEPIDPSIGVAQGKDGSFASSPIFDHENQQVALLVAHYEGNSGYMVPSGQTSTLAIALIGVGAFSIFVTFWLARKISAPVERVIWGAQELSACNFNMRLAPTRQRELNLLIDSFNSLANELKSSTVSQKYVNSIFDSISESLVILDTDGYIESTNPAFRLLTNYSENEIGRLKFADLLTLFNEPDTCCHHREVASVSNLDGEFLLRLSSGDTIPVSISCTSRLSMDNEIAGKVLMIKDIRESIETQAELKRLADYDTLTGSLNRRSFREKWTEFQDSLSDEPVQVGLLMLDIDYFKKINDIRGHLAGDEVLEKIGAILNEQVSRHGLVCRYGGEEFCILLFNQTEESACQFAENLRTRIANWPFVFNDRKFQVTCTFGIAVAEANELVLEELINRADQILNLTKRKSRNSIGMESDCGSLHVGEASKMAVDHLVQRVPSIYSSRTISDASQLFEEHESDWIVVIDEHGNYVGCLGDGQIQKYTSENERTRLAEIVDRSIPTFETGTELNLVTKFMERCNPPVVVVLNKMNANGVARPAGIVRHFAETSLDRSTSHETSVV